jgi:hypothetical protein
VICATNDFVQLAQLLALLINEQFRVIDDLDEEVWAVSNRSISFLHPRLSDSISILRRERGDDLFEARIAAERIPEGVQL